MPYTDRHPSPRQFLNTIHNPLNIRGERDHLHPFLIQTLLPVNLLEGRYWRV